MHYPDKMQALVDYAAAVGAARLTDGQGRIVVAGGEPPPEPRDGGAPRAEMKVGTYTLCVYPMPGMLPLAVAKRLEGCARLLRLLPAPLPSAPPRGGTGGSGPLPAALRVWPPSKRTR